MVEKIRFVIDESGEIQISVEGVQGRSCEAVTEPFEKSLGTLAKRAYKDSYHAEQATTEQNRNEGTAV